MSASSARPRNDPGKARSGQGAGRAPVRFAATMRLVGRGARHHLAGRRCPALAPTTAPDHSGAPTFGDVPVPNAPNTLAAAGPGAAPPARGTRLGRQVEPTERFAAALAKRLAG